MRTQKIDGEHEFGHEEAAVTVNAYILREDAMASVNQNVKKNGERGFRRGEAAVTERLHEDAIASVDRTSDSDVKRER